MQKYSEKKLKILNPIETKTRILDKRQTLLTNRQHLATSFNPDLSSKSHFSLFLKYSETSLDLVIPPTLIVVVESSQVILYYHSAGELHIETGEPVFKKFFDLLNESEPQKYRCPKFIKYSNSDISFHNIEDDFTSFAKIGEPVLLQQFVHPDKKQVSKMRILWDKDKGFTYWMIENKTNLSKTQWFLQESLKKCQSNYMFSVNDFNYAGRLLKTSLSPFNLYSSKIKKVSSNKTLVGKNNETIARKHSNIRNSISSNFYLAKQSDLANNSVYKLLIKYPKLESTIIDIMETVDKWAENLGTHQIKKSSFDFIEDHKGKWYLVGCKFQDIDFDSHMQSLNFTKVSIKGKYQVKEMRKEDIQQEQEKYKTQLFNIKERLESIKVKSAKFINLERDTLISCYKTISSSKSRYLNDNSQDTLLSPIAYLYDSTINKARDLKRKTQIYSDIMNEYISKAESIDSILDDIVETLSSHDYFSIYMKHYAKVMSFRDLIHSCLQGIVPSVKANNSQLLKDLGVNRRNFEDFILQISNVLTKYYGPQIKNILLEKIIESSGFT